ncbi:conserved hypothetical protein [Vibrio nigripulchritudo SOn1]|uniref:Uncharacterized protein n=1 Tax=Vibrio nigripulchritudo SOn1 TaxID=1238450 RepID=A0AAV2VQW5_9VIBR|nr:hypothetical protein [Vibrio nigripulchritudo]CCO46828.1 conserved hypothetical protein [Vibrio nigripulchritudo SOn1]
MPNTKKKEFSDYISFKDMYLKQYSEATLEYLHSLETREDWSIEVETNDLLATFMKLPAVCRKPFTEHDARLIEDLIRLLAYLPFVDSITSLAFLGLENEDYGYAIYEIAYQSSLATPPCVNSKAITDRVAVVNKIALLQTIKGRKI